MTVLFKYTMGQKCTGLFANASFLELLSTFYQKKKKTKALTNNSTEKILAKYLKLLSLLCHFTTNTKRTRMRIEDHMFNP